MQIKPFAALRPVRERTADIAALPYDVQSSDEARVIAQKNPLSFIVIDGHLRHCVREGIEKGNADETIESFAEALESFSKMA